MARRAPFAALALAAAVILSAAPAAAQSFDIGMMAYTRGDYREAARIWKELAGKGHAQAQTNLGALYNVGFGVPKDYIRAYALFSLAAAQGDSEARENLERVRPRLSAADQAAAESLIKAGPAAVLAGK